MRTIRLTMAQALVRAMAAQRTVVESEQGEAKILPFFGGVWAIFGHGNVAGMGEALYAAPLLIPRRSGAAGSWPAPAPSGPAR
jgi:3D-(3,5/4)-trihydroxycyclohexane-1,2-dione acylhydrolase (decyclizing)